MECGWTVDRNGNGLTVMMKIEYLESGSEDCPLLRLFEFEESDLETLRDVCLALAAGRITEIRLDGQAWVESIGGRGLVLRFGVKNLGARWGKRVTDAFTIEFNSEGWLEVVDKIEPLMKSKNGYQWLDDGGDFKMLLSWDGCW